MISLIVLFQTAEDSTDYTCNHVRFLMAIKTYIERSYREGGWGNSDLKFNLLYNFSAGVRMRNVLSVTAKVWHAEYRPNKRNTMATLHVIILAFYQI